MKLKCKESYENETRYNKDKVLQGQGVDEPLSETGFRQAEAAGRFLSSVKFTRVFSSDLIRAKQTAATILGKSRHCGDLEIRLDTRLRERSYGTAEGKPLSDLRAMAKATGEQCPSYTPPGGETIEQVRARAKGFFEFLCQLVTEEEGREVGVPRSSCEGALEPPPSLVSTCVNPDTNCLDSTPGTNVLVVSHGAYMRIWILYFVKELECHLPGDLRKAQELSISPNTGISQFVVSLTRGETFSPEVRCVCINQQDHLADLTPS
ncbi:LOW QUALITY PROTEIN: fructose-2,6-bisphosphatase TIGAR-like [Microcaecilia unicolor]|uniref:LOW QUALITY PROTEIN: fructose-2,6-bisphosphatase TIGAR-like n=1 Tax=Microcaecilia unicolor TaxID=1415580 RepID=A0A6P7Z4K4_9AMPH|nr:LOW QUALITY PROTEIN: fructose-2,6-bisphosphatase TIGAR-like [Microcaecilia unicolor]